jgi:hypothetical protein
VGTPRLQRALDREHPAERFDVERHGVAGLLEQRAVGVRQQDDRLLGMVDVSVGEVRLVVRDERDDVAPRHVSRGDDGDLIPGDGGIEVDLVEDAARDGAADRRAVQHAGQRQIVDVPRLAGDLGSPFLAGHGTADGGHPSQS